jgi:membrane protein YqaA with SNARE-associated domain
MIDFILHIDKHLGEMITSYGTLTYAILFAIVFMETGLVFTPFLPGDSLLFAAGAFAALQSLNIWVVFILLTIAAILGDTVNYWIGHFFGQKLISNPKIPIKQAHIDQTNQFFEKHYTTVEAAPGGLFEAYRPTDPSLSLEVLQLNAEREYPGIKRDDALKELQHLIVVLREVVVKRQRRELQYRIELAEKTKDTEQLNELLSQLQKLR